MCNHLMCAIVTCVHSSHLSTTRLATRPISFALCCAVKPETRADIEVARLALPRKRCGLGRLGMQDEFSGIWLPWAMKSSGDDRNCKSSRLDDGSGA
ncbi:hypothetical protein HBI81_163270 [Parastagonospora nodorum]|nr:hypothetical protein HBH51_217100 [Parastagonospora nodorum]KAH3967280.1 hypothetical protein HBH52_186330 [Parastagonospora nodorum]KAH4151599.1 hypothetical protein HBH43_238930 [Parastagonospora nodorum]KAH4251261.1 hypothetical protein HBI03_227860 [Parastagonospora nodorum]KAH5002851.1 hypothetical protein HBI74_237490 [Parastagonospora nodorum]